MTVPTLTTTGLVALGSKTSLRELSLSRTRVSARAPSLLLPLKSLERLSLREIQINDTTLKPLASLVELRVLDIGQTQVGSIEPLRSLTKLAELFVDNTDVVELAPLCSFNNLRVLHLGFVLVDDLAAPHLLCLTELRELDLSLTLVGRRRHSRDRKTRETRIALACQLKDHRRSPCELACDEDSPSPRPLATQKSRGPRWPRWPPRPR